MAYGVLDGYFVPLSFVRDFLGEILLCLGIRSLPENKVHKTTATRRRASQSEGGVNTPASVIQAVLASGDEEQLREAVIQAVAKKMSNIILLPLPKLDLKLPLSEYGMDSMLLAELRQYIFHSMGVDVPFLTLMDSTTSMLSVAGIVVEELGQVAGREE
ncbi:hypothetical protein AbraIFM66951_010563 [Aspergillus brasiliensis]|nr:hypothetical protein AbraIFM66951_010563 [Aspergillus brasiliensis]